MPLDRIGKSQHLGFGDANGKDTTVAILIYEASAGSRSYSFDDTLRLYGSFSPAQLTLQLDQQTGQYVLRENWGSVVKVEAGKRVYFNSKPLQQWANQGMSGFFALPVMLTPKLAEAIPAAVMAVFLLNVLRKVDCSVGE